MTPRQAPSHYRGQTRSHNHRLHRPNHRRHHHHHKPSAVSNSVGRGDTPRAVLEVAPRSSGLPAVSPALRLRLPFRPAQDGSEQTHLVRAEEAYPLLRRYLSEHDLLGRVHYPLRRYAAREFPSALANSTLTLIDGLAGMRQPDLRLECASYRHPAFDELFGAEEPEYGEAVSANTARRSPSFGQAEDASEQQNKRKPQWHRAGNT